MVSTRLHTYENFAKDQARSISLRLPDVLWHYLSSDRSYMLWRYCVPIFLQHRFQAANTPDRISPMEETRMLTTDLAHAALLPASPYNRIDRRTLLVLWYPTYLFLW